MDALEDLMTQRNIACPVFDLAPEGTYLRSGDRAPPPLVPLGDPSVIGHPRGTVGGLRGFVIKVCSYE